MKKIISLFVVLCIVLSAVPVMAADEVITLKVNGIVVETDTPPYIRNDRTMVPMRAIFEALGAIVTWNDDTKTARGVKGETTVEITVGENLIYKNGEATLLDCAAEIVNGRTMVPVRAIGEAFGATVTWDNDNRTVNIFTETKVIRIGTHAIYEDDPHYTDPKTGERYMDEAEAKAKIQALNKVKETLGVNIEFIQYTSSSYAELLAESIEKGEPFCDLATLWNGGQKSALIKDVIQPIDDYVDAFNVEEFPIQPKVQGHYYFMSRDASFVNTWPIVYNIAMLDSIPELKEDDGTTLYPAELYYRGEWTWSGFENYMSIISEHCKKYTNSIYSYAAPVPFETNYVYFAEAALHSMGASIYDGEYITADTKEALKAVEFTAGLFEKELVSCKSAEKHPQDSGWISGTDAFLSGKTYFTNCAPWKITKDYLGNKTGIVPFPYPDDTKTETGYAHSNHGGDCIALVKGVDEQTSRLAVLAYKTYITEYCKALADVSDITDFADAYAQIDAENRGIDTTHPEVGEYHAKIWAEYGKTPVNEYSEAMGILWKWSDAFGKYTFSDVSIGEYKEAVENMDK